MSDVYSLTIRNEPAEVARLTTWIEQLANRLALSADTNHAVQLCLEEAVTNILSHAFEPDAVHQVHVSVWRDDAALHAAISDDGRPFDLLSQELSPHPEDLESAAIGGLGIKLIRHFAKHIDYRRLGALNRLHLSFPPD